MKPVIAVISGGDSSEYVVSVKSGKNVFNAIDKSKFSPVLIQMKGAEWNVLTDGGITVPVDKSDFSFMDHGRKVRFDFAYITIHGTPGEDGILQGYFDLMQIPYSTCNLHASSLTFNKWICSNYLKNFGIKMAKSVRVRRGQEINTDEIISVTGLPAFVKPNAGGSSFGVTKVKDSSMLMEAIGKAWDESDEALVEEFISGKEFTCGLVKLKTRELVFPVTEVIPKNEFFDFEAKYTQGVTDEITPARLPESLFKKCQQLSSEIYDLCNCEGIVRIDYILNGNDFYFLEVNTTPGMTETSFIPQQISAMGLTLTEVLTLVIADRMH